jgi:hypothetical protein
VIVQVAALRPQSFPGKRALRTHVPGNGPAWPVPTVLRPLGGPER